MRRAPRAHRALLIAAAVGGASCSSGETRVGARVDRIVGGTSDDAHEAVVAVVATDGSFFCSGTLVSPTLVVTAAHCVYGVAASSLSVLTGPDVTSPTAAQTHAVASAIAYPTYRGESEGIPGGVDLAVVELAEPLATAPIEIELGTSDSDFQGASVTAVGYGASDGADNSGVGIRRSVALEVSTICSRLLTVGGADANVCLGDSGGAVLLGNRLVGLVSGGRLGCFAPSTLTRLDAHARWLSDVLAGSTTATCAECLAPDAACDAPTETPPAATDAGVDAPVRPEASWTVTGGGCAIGVSGARAVTHAGIAWLLGAAAVGLALRRRR